MSFSAIEHMAPSNPTVVSDSINNPKDLAERPQPIIAPDTLIPLDGRTSLDSEKMHKMIEQLYLEMRDTLEKSYLAQWNKQKEDIYRTIAILLKPNYPKTQCQINKDMNQENMVYEDQNKIDEKVKQLAAIDEEAYLFSIMDKIKNDSMKTETKKGRPKKKMNPWHHIL